MKNKKKQKMKNNKKIFLLFKRPEITKMYQLNHNSYYDFIVDNRGDIWMKVYNGYIHRMYRIFSKRHPTNLSKEIEKKIMKENIKRMSKSKYNRRSWY